MKFDQESRYLNGQRFAKECLGMETAPSINTYDVITTDGMHIHLDSLNHVMAAARMYTRTIGTNIYIEVSEAAINIRCRPLNCEGVLVNCFGDDLDLCDSIILCCLLVNQQLMARLN